MKRRRNPVLEVIRVEQIQCKIKNVDVARGIYKETAIKNGGGVK